MLTILLCAIGAYLAIGILMAVLLSNSPYSANGWIVIVLLWPLFLISLVG